MWSYSYSSTPTNVRVRVQGLGACLNLVGFEGLLGEEEAVVTGVREAVVAPSAGYWGEGG